MADNNGLTFDSTPVLEDTHVAPAAPKPAAPDTSGLSFDSIPTADNTPADNVPEAHKDFLSRVVDPVLKSQFVQGMIKDISGNPAGGETWLDKFIRTEKGILTNPNAKQNLAYSDPEAAAARDPRYAAVTGGPVQTPFDRPIVDLSQATTPEELEQLRGGDQANPVRRAGAMGVRAALELGTGMTSPNSLGLLLVSGGLGRLPGAAGKLLPRLASGAFSAQQVYAAWEQIPAMKEAVANGDQREAEHILSLMTGELAMTAAGGEHAATGESKPVLPGMDRAISRYAQIISTPIDAARNKVASGLENVAARGEAKVVAHRENLAALERQKMQSKTVANNALNAQVITPAEHARLTAEGAKPEDRAKFLHDRVTEDVLNNAAPEHRNETTASDDGSDFLMAAKKAASVAGSEFLNDPVIHEAIGKPSAQAAATLSKKLVSDTITHLRSPEVGQGALADMMIRTAENHIFREASIQPDKFLDNLNKGYETLRKNGVTDVAPDIATNAKTVRDLVQLRDQISDLTKNAPDASWKQKLLDTATNRTGRSVIMSLLGLVGGHAAAATLTGGALGLGGSMLYGTGKWILSKDATVLGLSKTARALSEAIKPETTGETTAAKPAATAQPTPVPKTETPVPEVGTHTPEAAAPVPEAVAPPAQAAPSTAGPVIRPRGEVSGEEYQGRVVAPEEQNHTINAEEPPARPTNVVGTDRLPSAQAENPVLDIANKYNEKRGAAPMSTRPVPEVDANAHKIADLYEAAQHNPADPKVAQTYASLVNETKAQWDFATQNGMKFEPWNKEGQPYVNSQEMMKDVQDNKHLYFFQGGDLPADHPLAKVDPATGLTYNDMFRAVHDLFGHAAHGYQFGPRGEEGAYQAHSQMFSPEAQAALLSETKAQNSWVNFGKHLRDESGNVPQKGQPGYVPPTERPYASQKATVLPSVESATAEAPRAPGAPPPEIAKAVDAMRKVGVDSEKAPVQSTIPETPKPEAAPEKKAPVKEEERTHDIREQFATREQAEAALPGYWGGEVFKEANRDIWHIRIPKGMRGSQIDIHEVGHALRALADGGDVGDIVKGKGGKSIKLDFSSLPADPEGAAQVAGNLASGQGTMSAVGARMRALAAGPATEGHVLEGVDPSVTKNWQDNVRDAKGKALSDRTKFGDLAKEVGVPEAEVQGLWDRHVAEHKAWLESKPGAVEHLMNFVNDPTNMDANGNISRAKIHDLYERINGERSPHAPKPAESDARSILDLHKTGGATYRPGKGPATEGYSVSMYPERSLPIKGRPLTEKDISDYTKKNKELLDSDPRNHVGTWAETDDNGNLTGNHWLDISAVMKDRDAAISAGKALNQKAIFDLSKKEEIKTGGTGEAPAGLPPESERLKMLDKKNSDDTANYLDAKGVKEDTDKAKKAGFKVVKGEDPTAGDPNSISWMHPADDSRIVLDAGNDIHEDVANTLHPQNNKAWRQGKGTGMNDMFQDGWVRVHQQPNGRYNLMYELGDEASGKTHEAIANDLMNRFEKGGVYPDSGVIFEQRDKNGQSTRHAAFTVQDFVDNGFKLDKTLHSARGTLRDNANYLDTPNVESTELMNNPEFRVTMDNLQDIGKALEAYTTGQRSAPKFFLNSTPREDMIGRATEALVAEAKQHLAEDVNGKDWYSKTLQEFKDKVKAIKPALKDPTRMDLFIALTAIASNGNGPNTNVALADKIDDATQRLGKIPSTAVDSNDRPIPGRDKYGKLVPGKFSQWGPQIGARSINALNQLIEDKGGVAPAMQWLKDKHPVDEVLKYSAEDSAWVKGAAPKGEPVYGSLMFGPKIGRFYQNLNGNFDVLTADRWFNRTWNRYMGTMFQTDKDGNVKINPKTGKPAMRDFTTNPKELSIMQETMERASKQLGLKVAELQAVQWYYEKELYRRFGHDEPTEDYSGAADYLAIKRGNRPTEVTGEAPVSPKANVSAQPVKERVPAKAAGRTKRMTEEMAQGLE